MQRRSIDTFMPAGFLGGLASGAALTWVLATVNGRRRLELLRDKAVHAGHFEADFVEKGVTDLRNRARSVGPRVRRALRQGLVDNEVLEARVRSHLGRASTHPRALEIEACDGVIEVRGPVLAEERRRVLRAVRRTPGVRRAVDSLEVHREADIEALQGEARRRPMSALRRTEWPPALRVAACTAGTALTGFGIARRGLGGLAAALAGGAVVLRATTNLSLRRLTGIGAGARAIDVRKTLTVNAPVEEVYGFLARFENFPRFMEHVQRIEARADGTSRWTVSGPMGAPVRWDAELTDRVENELIAWHTLPGSPVQHAGRVLLEGNDSTTRVQVEMSYNPPGGATGHLIAALFGTDPKSAMDDDFLRLKSLLERGAARAHGRRVTREQLG